MRSQSRVLDYKQQGGLRTPSTPSGLKGDRKDSQEHLDGKIWWREVINGLELKNFRLSHFPDRAGEQPSYLYSPGVFKSCPTVVVQFSTRQA